jgi:alpha/beta superfamily hydrolase
MSPHLRTPDWELHWYSTPAKELEEGKEDEDEEEEEFDEGSVVMETVKVEAGSGVSLCVKIFRPGAHVSPKPFTMVLVHPYSILGGCQELLRGMAYRLAAKGFTTLTFDMRGVGGSTGKMSLTGTSEVQDVVAVSQWATQHCSAPSIVLVGSSAGK